MGKSLQCLVMSRINSEVWILLRWAEERILPNENFRKSQCKCPLRGDLETDLRPKRTLAARAGLRSGGSKWLPINIEANLTMRVPALAGSYEILIKDL